MTLVGDRSDTESRDWLPRRRTGLRRSFVTLLVLVLAMPLAGFLLSIGDDRWHEATSLPELRERRAVYVPDMRAFVVATSEGPLGLSARSPHLGWEPIAYCRSSDTFIELAHGGLWDGRGFYLSGPPPRGMDRIPVREWWGVVELRVGVSIPGPPRGAGPPRPPAGPLCDGGEVGPPGYVSAPR